jgi:ABC-type polar amino acid transport system ATPase subunit
MSLLVNSSMPLLTLQDISKYFGERLVIDHLSGSFHSHQLTCIIGDSGAGKTTLLKCLLGLEPMSSGGLFWKGNPLQPKDRLKMGCVFQHFHLFPHKTVFGNLTYAPLLHRLDTPGNLKEKAMRFLSSVGLEGFINAYPKTLSGGQQQRIALLRALMMDPELLFLDEPTSALDQKSAILSLEIVREKKEKGMGVVVITHDITLAKNISDRVWLVDGGRLVIDTSRDDFFQRKGSVS